MKKSIIAIAITCMLIIISSYRTPAQNIHTDSLLNMKYMNVAAVPISCLTQNSIAIMANRLYVGNPSINLSNWIATYKLVSRISCRC